MARELIADVPTTTAVAALKVAPGERSSSKRVSLLETSVKVKATCRDESSKAGSSARSVGARRPPAAVVSIVVFSMLEGTTSRVAVAGLSHRRCTPEPPPPSACISTKS
jgi:hypothetical protein